MKILELAEEYAGINLFNPYSQKRAISVAALFVARSGVDTISSITLLSLARFKMETLAVAKPVTYNGYIKYLRLIGNYAVAKEYLQENPFHWIQTAPIGEIPKKILTHAEIETTLDNLENPELTDNGWFWSILVQCLYYTGMRRRQIVNLRRRDLNFEDSTICLTYSGSKTMKEWSIPMHESLKVSLQLLIHETEIIRGKKIKPDDFVFRAFDLFPRFKADKQGRMTPESITGYFKRLSLKNHFRIGAHRFRHTLATALCNPRDEGTPDLFAVQQLLGHNNISTTRGYVQTEMHRLGRAVSGIKPIGSKKQKI